MGEHLDLTTELQTAQAELAKVQAENKAIKLQMIAVQRAYLRQQMELGGFQLAELDRAEAALKANNEP